MNRNVNRGLLVGVSVLALSLVTADAFAQGGGGQSGGGQGGGGRQMQPGGGQGGGGRGGFRGGGGMLGGVTGAWGNNTIATADLERYAKILALTPEQIDAAKTLHEGYHERMQEQATKRQDLQRKTMEEFQESRDPGVWSEMGEKMVQIADAQKKIEKEFFEDVKSLLTKEQINNWGKVERTRRRDETLRMGGGMGGGFSLISGEGVDLIKLVEGLKLEEEQAKIVEPVLDRYSIDLDSALVSRNQIVEGGMTRQRELMEKVMSGDLKEADKIFGEYKDAAIRLRDVTRRYYKEVAPMLPQEQQAKFETEFKRASFPQIYRQQRGGAQATIDAALKLEGINDTQKKGIEAISESYKRDMASINKQAEQAQEENEKNLTLSGMMGGGAMQMFGGGPAMEEIRTKRRELDTKTSDAVRGLLTEEQKNAMPRDNNRGGDGGFPGRGGDGGNGDRPMRPRGGGGNGGGGGGGNGGGGNRNG